MTNDFVRVKKKEKKIEGSWIGGSVCVVKEEELSCIYIRDLPLTAGTHFSHAHTKSAL